MKKNMFRIAKIGLTAALSLLTPVIVFADTTIPDTIPFANGGSVSDIANAIGTIVGYASGLAAAIAVGYLIYGGFLYIAGGEKGPDNGKKMIVNSVMGLVVIALAFVIVRVVVDALGQIGS